MDKVFPRISVITPSFNQHNFIEKTIASVLNQNYPNLEYIIIDGGSIDNSVDIIKKYEKHLYYWVSEKDNGQSHAINKGFAKATGDIVCWLNSDDCFIEGTLNKIADIFSSNKVFWATGQCLSIDEKGNVLNLLTSEVPKNSFHWLNLLSRGFSFAVLQPATFWKKEIFDKVGLLNEKMNYAFDHEFFFRVLTNFGNPYIINEPLAEFRLHSQSKTVAQSNLFTKENRKIARLHIRDQPMYKQCYLWMVYFKSRLWASLKT